MAPLLRLSEARRQHLSRQSFIWRRRVATTGGAIGIGLIALAFARVADAAQALFDALLLRLPLAPLVLTPVAFAAIAAITRRYAPASRGSGIPQIIVAARHPDRADMRVLTSLRTACWKFGLTIAALLAGASVGREGPTVQIGAAVLRRIQEFFRIPVNAAAIIAGGAAGVSAAFNTPLAGVAFAIEELASAYEQKLALLVMAAVMISGLVSLGVAGDYIYFGGMPNVLSLRGDLMLCPVAGVLGGLSGGLFSRAVLAFGDARWAPLRRLRDHPVLWAGGCGLVIAVVGIASAGKTWGTGYEAARQLVVGGTQPLWFAPAKFATTLLTTLAGLPGGIFAPSLATGAGVGGALSTFFPGEASGPIVMLGMIAYFVGVTRAPLTAVLITSEMTDSRGMIIPLFAAALIADGVSALICPERIYHGLARGFSPKHAERPIGEEPANGPAVPQH